MIVALVRPPEEGTMQKLASLAFTIIVVAVASPVPDATLAGSTAAVPDGDDGTRGCCSHHGGVCGCSAGRTTCCDGQTSPTCSCVSP